jgi:hypothetical protein
MNQTDESDNDVDKPRPPNHFLARMVETTVLLSDKGPAKTPRQTIEPLANRNEYLDHPAKSQRQDLAPQPSWPSFSPAPSTWRCVLLFFPCRSPTSKLYFDNSPPQFTASPVSCSSAWRFAASSHSPHLIQESPPLKCPPSRPPDSKRPWRPPTPLSRPLPAPS